MTLDKLLGKKIKSFTVMDILVMTLAVVLASALKWSFADLKFPDYTMCLKPWTERLASYGGFKGLAYEIGNYTPAYMHFLMIFSYFQIEPVYLIKLLGIVVDIFLAIAAALLLGHGKSNGHKIALFTLILVLPTVIINSGMWGQCDNFYTLFLLCSMLAAVSEWKLPVKLGKLTFTLKTDDIVLIFVGIAFSFKLQTIFLVPVFAVWFLLKDYRLQTILWIPVVYLIMCIPSLIAGRSLRNLLTIYFRQTQDYGELQLNFPNIYSFWQSEIFAPYFSNGCILFCVIALMILVYYIYIKKPVIDLGFLCSLGTFSVFLITYLLPHMHDRYAFVGEILAFYYPVENRKKLWIPLLANVIALESYMQTLLWFSFENFNIYGAILRGILIVVTGMDVIKRCQK